MPHYFIPIPKESEKLEVLLDLYGCLNVSQIVIFCDTKSKVNDVVQKLRSHNHPISPYHTDQDQSARDTTIKDFRAGAFMILVSAFKPHGLAAKDVRESLLIRFDFPVKLEGYFDHLGGSGPDDVKNTIINLVTEREKPSIKSLEEAHGIKIEELPEDFTQVRKSN